MYKADDMVMYGKNGVCRVLGIEKMSYSKHEPEKDYYVLAPLHDRNAKYYVPIDSELLTSKLRHIMTKDEIDATLAAAKDSTMEWVEDKALRAIKFKAIIVRGDRSEMLTLANCIYTRKKEKESEGKRIWASDEQVLANVERLISEEFACSLGIHQNKVGEYIREKLGVN